MSAIGQAVVGKVVGVAKEEALGLAKQLLTLALMPTTSPVPPMPPRPAAGKVLATTAVLGTASSSVGGSVGGSKGGAGNASGSSRSPGGTAWANKDGANSHSQAPASESSGALNTNGGPNAPSDQPAPGVTPDDPPPELKQLIGIEDAPENECKPGDVVVAGIGGTSSGDPSNADAHVEKLVRDYDTAARNKYFHDGPTHAFPVGPISEEMQSLEDAAYNHIRRRLEERPDLPVDIYGHSRGGVAALQLAARLEREGVPVRIIGLYDPVDMAIGYGGQECVSGNVANTRVVRTRDDDAGGPDQSREWFRRPRAMPCDVASTGYEAYASTGSHAAVGGNPGTAPWNDSGGRFGTLDAEENEIRESRRSDEFVRQGAESSGAKIRPRTDYDTHSQNLNLKRQSDLSDAPSVPQYMPDELDRRNLERLKRGLPPVER